MLYCVVRNTGINYCIYIKSIAALYSNSTSSVEMLKFGLNYSCVLQKYFLAVFIVVNTRRGFTFIFV